MPLQSSPNQTPAGMPLTNAGSLGRAIGYRVQFASNAALLTAIAANTTDPLWSDGAILEVAGEGGTRKYNLSGDHARNVSIGSGFSYTLAANSNKIILGTGTPTGGNTGDLWQGTDTGNIYLNTSGTWGFLAKAIMLQTEVAAAVALANGRKLATVGDSFIARGFLSNAGQLTQNAQNPITWALALSNYPMSLMSQQAVGGSQISANGTGVKLLTQIQLAIAAGATDILYMGGVNDVINGVPLATMQSEFIIGLNAVLGAGLRMHVVVQPFFDSAYASYTVARQAQMMEFARWLLDQVAVTYATRNVIVIDAASYTVDPASATGSWKTNGTIAADRLHPRNVGAYYIGKAIATVWLARLPTWDRRIRSNADNYGYSTDNSHSLLDNGLLVTTGGTPSGSGAGFTVTSNGATVTPTLVARADGFGNDCQLACTATASGDTVTWASGNLHSRAVLLDYYIFEVEITVPASPANLLGVQVTLQQNDGSLYEAHALLPDIAADSALPEGFTAVIRTPPVQYKSGSTIMVARIRATFLGASTLNIKVGRASVRRLYGTY